MPSPAILCALALAAWLLLAAWADIRSRRIPNALVLAGIVCGLTLQVLAPQGGGLFAFWWGGLGAVDALLGLLAGLALFMPLYLLRAVGAGDVKLLAMVGVWLGPKLIFGAALLTLVAGGLLALLAMLATRSSRRILANVRFMLTTAMVGASAGKFAPLVAPAASGMRLPYALAIAAGTLAQLVWLLARSGP